jgi:hypothetical protein
MISIWQALKDRRAERQLIEALSPAGWTVTRMRHLDRVAQSAIDKRITAIADFVKQASIERRRKNYDVIAREVEQIASKSSAAACRLLVEMRQGGIATEDLEVLVFEQWLRKPGANLDSTWRVLLRTYDNQELVDRLIKIAEGNGLSGLSEAFYLRSGFREQAYRAEPGHPGLVRLKREITTRYQYWFEPNLKGGTHIYPTDSARRPIGPTDWQHRGLPPDVEP